MIKSESFPRTIQLWSARLCELEADSESLLDEQERKAAARFRFAERRRLYVKSRSLLRRILARTLGEEATRIRIAYRDKGKPYLPDHALHFSVSHSHDRWIAALTGVAEIGADIEKIAPLSGMEAIMRNYYHKEARDTIARLEPERKIEAFYRHWTQAEAFVKLYGTGLRAGMNTIRRSGHGLLFADDPGSYAACDSFRFDPEYIVSIAMRGALLPVAFMEWTESRNLCGEE